MKGEFLPGDANAVLTKESAVRLGGCYRDILEALPDLGSVYIQARNSGGGLGKAVSKFCPATLEDEDFAIDPDTGIAVSLSEWIGIHGGILPFESERIPALDFEFACFTSGLSLLEIPGLCDEGAIQDLACRFFDSEITSEELIEWRDTIEGQPDICPCCQKASEIRAENVESHPLYEICRQASLSGFELRFRIQAPHIDMVSAFTPSKVHASNGFLVILPQTGDAAWHVDMRMVHSLRISTIRMDGEKLGQLEIFDMFGNRNFQVTCDVPDIDAAWESICRRG